MARMVLIVAALVCGLAASCFVIGQRAGVESADRSVEIVVDYTEVEQIAASMGRTPAEVLRSFRKAGAVSAAVAEQTVADLIQSHRMVPYGEHQFSLEERLGQRVAERLQAALARGSERVTVTPLPNAKSCYVTLADDVPLSYLEQVPVGLPDEALAAASEAGMQVVARVVSYPGASPRAIESELDYLKRVGISKAVFQGDQVLGFRGGVRYTANALQKTGIVFGRVEFAKQKGELQLAANAPANVLLVHSVPQNEMPGLDPASIVERFQRAVRERGARLCYVRMLDTSSQNLVEVNSDYLARVSQAISQAGFRLRNVQVGEDVSIPGFVRTIAGAGAGAGAVLLILAIVDLSALASVLWGVGLIALSAGLAASGYTGRGAAALIAAIAFPTLGALWAVRSSPESPIPAQKPLLKALGRVLTAVVITGIGAAIVAGLLSERSYMLRIHQFMGVKLAHLLPILILAVLFGSGLAWQSETWTQQKRKLGARFKEISASPMMIWQAALALALLIVVGMMVARSGNEPGVGVSDFELKLRAVLDKLLYVRPRTKEFLVGYPALFIGLAFVVRGLRQIAAPLIVIGSIAPVSALNSFCHIHTPLLLSAIRVANGAVFGCAIGMLVYWFVRNAQEWGRVPRSRK